MPRRSTLVAAFALGGAAGLAWARRAALRSLAVRLLSHRVFDTARRHGLRIDLGPARGQWVRVALAADLGPTLSEVIGTPIEAAASSRFGGFIHGRPYSAYLDPLSPYYQAWLGAYAVFDRPDRPPFGFDATGAVRTADMLDVLEADQRLVFHSLGCPNRFPDGRCTRPIGDLMVEPLTIDGERWWRVTGEAETWSTYSTSPDVKISRRARWLYGTAVRSESSPVRDFHPLRYAGEFWLRHDPALGATCAAFLVAPFLPTPGRSLSQSEPLLLASRSLLRQVRFIKCV